MTDKQKWFINKMLKEQFGENLQIASASAKYASPLQRPSDTMS